MSNLPTSFTPQAVYDYFIGITQQPHPSANQEGVTGSEDPVRAYACSQAKAIPNVEVKFYDPSPYDPNNPDPGKRVIVLRRPGSGNYANKTPVILQAHMDMVYNPVDMEFPLNVISDTSHTDGKWIKAQDKSNRSSTLGADDGLGVATALALLADPNLKDYPMECLFTVQEETDMGGAQNFDLNLLTGRQLLNLDAEDLTVIIYGSAGGCCTQYQKNDISRISKPQDYTALKLSISGLRGGHSGVDINKGRLNAIKVLAQALARLNKRITALDIVGAGIGSYDFLLYDIKRNDVKKSNAIPTEVEAVISLPKENVDQFTADFNAFCSALKIQNLPEESGFTCAAATITIDDAVQPLNDRSTDALICLLQQIPHGVISMIPGVPGVVETSTNLYGITIDGNTVTIGASNRSSCDESLIFLSNVQANIGSIFQFNVTIDIDSYPSWQPNPDSPLLKIAEGVYSDPQMYGDQYKATVIHAGLECGTISARYKEVGISVDCISIGPTIKNPHSPSETLQTQATDGTETVQKFYDAVTQILEKVFAS